MMIDLERIPLIVNLNLKLQGKSQVHAIALMQIYLLKELHQPQIRQPQTQPQIMTIKKSFLKIALHFLIA